MSNNHEFERQVYGVRWWSIDRDAARGWRLVEAPDRRRPLGPAARLRWSSDPGPRSSSGYGLGGLSLTSNGRSLRGDGATVRVAQSDRIRPIRMLASPQTLTFSPWRRRALDFGQHFRCCVKPRKMSSCSDRLISAKDIDV